MELPNKEKYSNFMLFGLGKETPKQKRNKEFRKKLKDELKHGKAGKALLTIGTRYNPLVAVARAGVIAGYRVNIFGIATRLYPAFLTGAELKAKHYNISNAIKTKKAWENVSKLWRGMGGNPESLKKIIENAHDKPIFKTKKSEAKKKAESGFGGESFSNVAGIDDATMGIILAGIPVLTTMVGLIAKSGASKNPYDNKNIDTSGMETDPADELTIAEIKAMEAKAKEDKEAGDDGDDDTIWGVNKTVFIAGASVVTLGVAFGIFKLVQHLNKK